MALKVSFLWQAMQIITVEDIASKKAFHAVPHKVYRGVKNYVYSLEQDIEFVFNKKKNPAFNDGDAIRFVLFQSGKPIGRIAAFYSNSQNKLRDYPVGGMGFFECINNQEAAFLLFKKAEDWLIEKGMMACDGPISFGERDKYWGLLIEGKDEDPTYLESFNPSYYQEFVTAYGFKEYKEQVTFKIDRENFNASRFTRVAEWISRKPGFSFVHFKMAESKKFAQDLTTIYNKAWEKQTGFQPITVEKALSTFKAMKNILIEEFIWFAYAHGEPVGMIIMIPDINVLLKPLRGKFNIIGKLRFLYYRKSKSMHRAKGLVFGVVPEYRSYGIETVLIYKFYKEVSKNWQYHTVELSWTGSVNSKMTSLMHALNAKICKRHMKYRKPFDDSISVELMHSGE